MSFHENLATIKLANELNDTNLILSAKVNQGEAYLARAYYVDALSVFTDASKLAYQQQNKRALGVTLNGIAKSYAGLNKYDSTLKYSSNALQISLEANDLKEVGVSYNTLATVYQNQENYDSALSLLILCRNISNSIGDARTTLTAYTNTANIYLDKGLLSKAENYCDSAIEIAVAINDPTMQKVVYKLQSLIEEKKGNYKNALTLIRIASSIDSNNSSESAIKKFNSAKNKHEFEDMQHQIELDKIANERTESKIYYITHLLMALTVILALLLLSIKLLNTNKPLSALIMKVLILFLAVVLTLIFNQITGKIFSEIFKGHPIRLFIVLIIDYYIVSFLHQKLVKILLPKKYQNESAIRLVISHKDS